MLIDDNHSVEVLIPKCHKFKKNRIIKLIINDDLEEKKKFINDAVLRKLKMIISNECESHTVSIKRTKCYKDHNIKNDNIKYVKNTKEEMSQVQQNNLNVWKEDKMITCMLLSTKNQLHEMRNACQELWKSYEKGTSFNSCTEHEHISDIVKESPE